MNLGCPMTMSGIVQSHPITSFVTSVSLVHEVFDFLGELCLYLGSLQHVEVVAIRRHTSKWLLDLLVENHV